MRVLNLYAGIGGNRKLWEDCEVTAIEYDSKIAAIYKDLFPNDNVIVADAHQYLLDHYKEFDFIWSSPPCPSHSRMGILGIKKGFRKAKYIDLKLYQEIILLKNFFKGKWCVENVVTYYKPLIIPTCISDQYFWANFPIKGFKDDRKKMVKHGETILELPINVIQQYIEINLDIYKIKNKRLLLNNAVYPKLGLYIYQNAKNIFLQPKLSQALLF